MFNEVLLAGLFIMFTTSLGSALGVFFKKLPSWGLDFSLAFSGGIMLVASFTSLILPALEIGDFWKVAVGIVLGIAVINLIDIAVPHEKYLTRFSTKNEYAERIKHISMIVTAIIIHNIPEGLAVGISMVNDTSKGWATAVAIGIQDIPEGLAVSLPLIFITERIWVPILIGILSGLAELIFAVLGGLAFSTLSLLLPIGLSFAGGAMIYVTIKEVFPEVYKNGNEEEVTLGFSLGLLIMLYLDTALG